MMLFMLKFILISVLAPNTCYLRVWTVPLIMFCQSLSHIMNCSKNGWLRHCTVWWMQEQFNARQRCHKCLGQIKGHTLNFSRWQNTLESRLLLWLQSHKRHVQRQKSPRPSFMRRPILRPDNCTWAHNSFHGIIGQQWLLLRFQIKISGGYICYKGISSNIWINSAGAVYNCTGGESSNCESPQKVWIGGESLLCSGEGWGSLSTHMYYVSLILFVSAITIMLWALASSGWVQSKSDLSGSRNGGYFAPFDFVK